MNLLKFTSTSVIAATIFLFSNVASAIPILSFIIDGDTAFEPFSITNNSTSGEYVTGFHLDITSTGNCFDVTDIANDACPGNAANGLVPFSSQNGSGLITGLVAPSVSDGETVLDLVFTDFASGESFVWDLDIDPIGGGRIGTILGHQLIGATAYVDFSSGERLFGSLGAVAGNADASALILWGLPKIVLAADIATVPVPSSLSLFVLAAALGVGSRKKIVR